ncbi:30S ribosome-binding factor RbfA [Roseimicrobium sp. ORNL1]|uniref:30S ribosome-binding factor RbfA n=1 Tax=Roseimicrobium sp. ORNL1 TaxID=2711231 RepID=UPI0013E10BED|nr:30S ribosome-binding factor RbfA [Roseimicrobium sp. ORNL1]QIF03057.1 30S ribosome-binding factor RbfA [Roseimicrobium sp. ORNL1]
MNHRLKRVTELIKRELGPILDRNLTFKGCFVTIHDVEITTDLKHATIHVSILGDSMSHEDIIKKLHGSRSIISRELYKRVTLKNSPQLHFKATDSIERGVRVLNLIENLPEPLPDEEPETEGEGDGEDEESKEDGKR